MKEFWKNLKNWQKWGIIGSFLVLMLIVIVVVVVIINSEPNVKINFDQDVSIPSGEIRKIREELVKVISDNTENYNSKNEYIGKARNYQESLSDETNIASFIVDFDDILESYKVDVSWPKIDDDIPNIIISCPLLESKYPKTPCKTETNTSTELFDYLPYIGIANKEKYRIIGNYDKNGKLYLTVQIGLDEDDLVLAEALKSAKEWVKQVGFNPDDYAFYAIKATLSDGTINFYNQDILTSAFTEPISNVILNNVRSAILADADGNFDATINVEDFYSYDAYTISFSVKISDGREYFVIAEVDSFKDSLTYIYTAVSEKNSNKMLIFINGDSNNQNAFSDFAKEIMGKSLVKIISSELVI